MYQFINPHMQTLTLIIILTEQTKNTSLSASEG